MHAYTYAGTFRLVIVCQKEVRCVMVNGGRCVNVTCDGRLHVVGRLTLYQEHMPISETSIGDKYRDRWD